MKATSKTRKSAKKTRAKKRTTKTAARSIKTKRVTPARVRLRKQTGGKKLAKRRVVRTRPVLMCVEGEHCFWANNGAVLSTLRDLRNELNNMTDEEYQYHANADRNDFADWVESVLCDDVCAKGLRRARRRATAYSCVKRCLVHYKR